jgi:Uri superfamily endonuclease
MVSSPTQLACPELPRRKGSYLLLLELSTPQTITVGRLGALDFVPGLYAYVGSARGPGGLAARLRHHLKRSQSCHWHIDYLRLAASVAAIWVAWEPIADNFSECQLAGLLERQCPFYPPFKGFGSSDCTCASHLLHWPLPTRDPPSLALFREAAILRLDDALSPLTRLLPAS